MGLIRGREGSPGYPTARYFNGEFTLVIQPQPRVWPLVFQVQKTEGIGFVSTLR